MIILIEVVPHLYASHVRQALDHDHVTAAVFMVGAAKPVEYGRVDKLSTMQQQDNISPLQ